MMRELREPSRAYLLAAMLSGDDKLFDEAIRELVPFFGHIKKESENIAWQHSAYYEKELGRDLFRKFVFFSRPIDPIELASAKHVTMDVERKLGKRDEGKLQRRINIDPGYMTRAKLVLASSKDFSHRIYIGNGVYAEVTLYFKDGCFRPFFYTYRDYRDDSAIKLFNAVRDDYFSQVE